MSRPASAFIAAIGTAIPALVHVSHSGGTDPNTSMAAQASQAQGGSAGGKNPDGGSGTAGGSDGSPALMAWAVVTMPLWSVWR